MIISITIIIIIVNIVITSTIITRRLLGTVLTVYIPTVLLVIISHMTNYFKPFFFEAVVSVNLTVMLVEFIHEILS